MQRFWVDIIKPLFEAAEIKRVVEVGCDLGLNTNNLIEYCKENGGFLEIIDPAPRIDVDETYAAYKGFYNYHNALSLNVIWKLEQYDAILLDGDHNWYTVYNELQMIKKSAKKFPLVLFHDISWPYDRRDLYYNVSTIPPEFVQPYAQKGIDIETDELVDKGGFNNSFNNSVYYNNNRCGVKTAVEDFVAENNDKYKYVGLPIFNGLGVLYSEENKYSEKFCALVEELRLSDNLNRIMVKTDKFYAKEHERLLAEKHKTRKLEAEISIREEKAAQYEEELEQCKENLAQCEEELAQYEEDLTWYKEETVRYKKDAIQNNERLNRITNENNALVNKNKELEKRIAALNRRLSEENDAFAANVAQMKFRGGKTGIRYAVANIFKGKVRSAFVNIKGIKKIRKTAAFNSAYYLKNNKDVLNSRIDPLVHYVWFGGYEGRDPSKDFSSAQYLSYNADVKKSGINPFVHYVLYGKNEGRTGKITASKKANAFAVLEKKPLIPKNIIVSEDESLVSIIMPTWNREQVICNAVDSVLKQTYENYELIIVDDGSTDNTGDVIRKKYKSQLETGKIKYILQENAGVCAARNRGLEESKGYYIAYLDSDNLWKNNYLATMVEAFESNPEIQTAYSDVHVYDNINKRERIREDEFNRKQLIQQNFIDLNIFMHRKSLYYKFGGFDLSLKRLVDWDLIIRYTRDVPAYHVKQVLADYFIEPTLNHITSTVNLDENRSKVLKKNRRELMSYGVATINVAYILWDYPAGSQTFVFNEIKYLMENGCNVQVFYKVKAKNYKEPDFYIKATMVKDANDLAEQLISNDIDYMHAHFAYPTAYELAYKASQITRIPYSFAAHAVDIFLYVNQQRNKVDEVANYENCEMVLVPGGKFHLDFLKDKGVYANKISVVNQTVGDEFLQYKKDNMNLPKKWNKSCVKIVAIGRFIEKKGFEYLIKAAEYLDKNYSIDIYGYGENEDIYKNLIAKHDKHNIVKLCGSIPNALDCLKTADILAAPCVVAENGDIDGMPTVVLEAMAAGVMVVATDVSSVPYVVKDNYNGFIVSERDERMLAEKIRYAASLSDAEKQQIINNGYKSVGTNEDTRTMASAVLENIKGNKISLFMVTYCDGDFTETKEIIDNIFEKTVSRFTLTIVDNASPNKEFIDYLKHLECEYDNVNVVLSRKNLWCGPASNLALNIIDTDYAIYICSNEGYPVEYGWEKRFVDYMNMHKDCALAGGLSFSPKLYSRETYKAHEVFPKFRNQSYIDNMSDPIKFVQGGIYIIRMDAFRKVGGFSDVLVQSHMDVEYSYYLQSCGYSIGSVDDVYAGTKSTLPKPSAMVNDCTAAVHPYTKQSLDELEETVSKKNNICNICGYKGSFANGICPDCSSSPSDRCLYQYFSGEVMCYNKDFGVDYSDYNTNSAAFTEIMKKMFSGKGIPAQITNSDNIRFDESEKIIYVCDDLQKAADSPKYDREVKQYYSRAAEFGKWKIVLYTKKH